MRSALFVFLCVLSGWPYGSAPCSLRSKHVATPGIKFTAVLLLLYAKPFLPCAASRRFCACTAINTACPLRSSIAPACVRTATSHMAGALAQAQICGCPGYGNATRRPSWHCGYVCSLLVLLHSIHTSATPVAVVPVLKELNPCRWYNRTFRSLWVLVNSTKRLAPAPAIMASSRAEPQPLPCHTGSTASLPM